MSENIEEKQDLVFIRDLTEDLGYKEVHKKSFIGDFDIIRCNFPACNNPAKILSNHFPYHEETNACEEHKALIHEIDFRYLEENNLLSYEEWLMKKRIESDKFIKESLSRIVAISRQIERHKKRDYSLLESYKIINSTISALKMYCECNYINFLFVLERIRELVDLKEMNKILFSEVRGIF